LSTTPSSTSSLRCVRMKRGNRRISQRHCSARESALADASQPSRYPRRRRQRRTSPWRRSPSERLGGRTPLSRTTGYGAGGPPNRRPTLQRGTGASWLGWPGQPADQGDSIRNHAVLSPDDSRYPWRQAGLAAG
jgi:hypothetical protein